MTVIAIGDSNVFPGMFLDSVNSADALGNCSHVFANSIGHGNAHVVAKCGASNHWILDKINHTLDNIDQYLDPIFFIGWTQWEREEWEWGNEEISVCIGPHFPVPADLEQRYCEWRDGMTNSTIQDMRDVWHKIIHTVHLRMTDMNIPHQFWSTYDNFVGKSGKDQLDWSGNFFMPYDINGCMSSWYKSQNIDPVPGDIWHWPAEASTIWGNTLADSYKQRII